MKSYKDDETGLSLFELHKNQSGKGIPKFMSDTPFGRKSPTIDDIVNGREDASSFNLEKIKSKMIEAGYLLEQCYYCGFDGFLKIIIKIILQKGILKCLVTIAIF